FRESAPTTFPKAPYVNSFPALPERGLKKGHGRVRCLWAEKLFRAPSPRVPFWAVNSIHFLVCWFSRAGSLEDGEASPSNLPLRLSAALQRCSAHSGRIVGNSEVIARISGKNEPFEPSLVLLISEQPVRKEWRGRPGSPH